MKILDIITEDTKYNKQFDILESLVTHLAVVKNTNEEIIWESLEDHRGEIDPYLVFQLFEKSDKNPRAGGLSKAGVKKYRREHPGSKIQTAVTAKPSKLKPGSKAAKRRKSFCARMRGMKKHNTSAKTARDPNSNINKSLRRWHC
jgi:hypothetical protein